MVRGGRVVRCRTCDGEVADSNPTRDCCAPTPTQHAIPPGSVNEYQRKLRSKRAYHAMHWPRIRGLAASAGVRLRAKEKEVIAQERTLLLYFTYTLHRFTKKTIDSVWRAVPLQVMRFLGYKDENSEIAGRTL